MSWRVTSTSQKEGRVVELLWDLVSFLTSEKIRVIL